MAPRAAEKSTDQDDGKTPYSDKKMASRSAVAVAPCSLLTYDDATDTAFDEVSDKEFWAMLPSLVLPIYNYARAVPLDTLDGSFSDFDSDVGSSDFSAVARPSASEMRARRASVEWVT